VRREQLVKMNPSNDALVQQMLLQNQMLMQMVLAQQPGALRQVQPVVLPQPPLAVPQPAAQPELRQVEPEEREEILPQDVQPFEPIKYDQFKKLPMSDNSCQIIRKLSKTALSDNSKTFQQLVGASNSIVLTQFCLHLYAECVGFGQLVVEKSDKSVTVLQ